MDALTHVLVGACMARAGLNRSTVLATPTLLVAAEAPDLDVAAKLNGPVSGFLHDRGITHSVAGVALLAIAMTCLMYAIWRMGGRGRNVTAFPKWWVVLVLSLLAGLSHILLDFTDSYGVRPFWPLSDQWYSWDITYIADPVVTLILFGGLFFSVLVSLMAEEFSGMSKIPRGRLAALLALVSVVAVWGVRDHEHRRALHALEAHHYDDGSPVRASAFALWWNPYVWTGVVETARSITAVQLDSRTGDFDPQVEPKIRYKAHETPATMAAESTVLGRAFMKWAHFPITESETLQSEKGGYVVVFKDLGFEFTGPRAQYSPFAVLTLNRDFTLADMSFADSQP